MSACQHDAEEEEEVRQEQTGRSNNECIRGPGVATAFRQRWWGGGGAANNEQLNRTEVAPRPCDSAGHSHTNTNTARATYSNRIKWAYLFYFAKGKCPARLWFVCVRFVERRGGLAAC